MSTPEQDLLSGQEELLRSIAASLKGIQSSLEHLTGAVEGVAESIETAHEPEGDLGVHLVGALKELTSALHKRAQQERALQPQQRQNIPHHPQQNRRDDRPQQRPDLRLELHPRQDKQPQDAQQVDDPSESQEHHLSESRDDSPLTESHEEAFTDQSQNPQGTRPPKPRPNRNRRGNRGKQPSVSPSTHPDSAPAAME